MKCCTPCIDEAAARKYFDRHWLGPPGRALARVWIRLLPVASPPGVTRGLPYVDRVWLPYYHLRFGFEFKKGPNGTAEALVGGHEATFSVVSPGKLTIEECDQADAFAPQLDAATAEQTARSHMTLMYGMSRRVPRRLQITTLEQCEVVQYPYWAYYFARRRGILDVRLLDAVTGRLTGPRLKVALMAAMAQRASSDKTPRQDA